MIQDGDCTVCGEPVSCWTCNRDADIAEIARLRAEVEKLSRDRDEAHECIKHIERAKMHAESAHDEDRRIGAALRALVRSYDGSAHVWRGGRYTAAVGFSLSATVRGESRTFFSTTLVEALERAVRE